MGTAEELLAAVEELRPDVAVVDIRMPPTWNDEGLAVAEEIRRRYPQVGVLLLSQYIEAEYALRLLEGGSERIGYLLKERVLDVGDLVRAIERVERARPLSTRRSCPTARRAREGVRSISSPRANGRCCPSWPRGSRTVASPRGSLLRRTRSKRMSATSSASWPAGHSR